MNDDSTRAGSTGMSEPGKSGAEGRKRTAGAFDIRNVIGGLLGAYGVILTLTGIFAESTPAVADPDDYNSNLIAGLVLLVVGAGFAAWARLRPIVVADEKDITPES
ncbi:MAG: hypothetical protein M3445_09870 [Actinomycetota bacterium]|nr:hypothetical protein [Actinomycetota bacterium]